MVGRTLRRVAPTKTTNKLLVAASLFSLLYCVGCVEVHTESMPNRYTRHRIESGIYERDQVVKGNDFGMKAPPGFSYRIRYGTVDAAINGNSEKYIRVDRLSQENLDIVQEQYANAIADGISRALRKSPPEGAGDKVVIVVTPNYYPGPHAKPFDLALDAKLIPYEPSTAAGKDLQKQVKAKLQENWQGIVETGDEK